MNARAKQIDKIIVLLTVLIMIPLFMPQRKSAAVFLSFSHPAGLGQSTTGLKQINEEKKKEPFTKKEIFVLRSFEWLGVAKKQLKAVYRLYKKDINNEKKSFGISHWQTSPLLMKKKGYMEYAPNCYRIDYKKVFQRNREYFPSLTQTLLLACELLPEENPLFEFLVFVQQIPFKLPPKYYEGRFIDSFFTPLICLYEKFGDCDTKSLLLAEFLNTSKAAKEKIAMVMADYLGVSHSILAINRKPFPGMTTLYHPQMGYFIPLETSTPGWSPGFMGKYMTDLIQRGEIFFVDLN